MQDNQHEQGSRTISVNTEPLQTTVRKADMVMFILIEGTSSDKGRGCNIVKAHYYSVTSARQRSRTNSYRTACMLFYVIHILIYRLMALLIKHYYSVLTRSLFNVQNSFFPSRKTGVLAFNCHNFL